MASSTSLVDAVSRSDIPSRVSIVTKEHAYKRLVEQSSYREHNLFANNIFMRSPRDPLPDHVAELVTLVRRSRDSPGITHDQVLQDQALEDLGADADEGHVAAFFREFVLREDNAQHSLQRHEGTPMLECTVPNTASDLRVSKPVPDILYGYRLRNAFPSQWTQLLPLVKEVSATNLRSSSLYPFFSIKFKGDMGSMWVATNQCLGASSSCVNISEDLNSRLKQCGSNKVIASTVFSLATNGTEARLYVSWKHDEVNYYTVIIRSFMLQDSKHYIEFYNTIRNIIDWGCGQRLDEIREAMDILLSTARKRAPEVVESHTPPRPDAPNRTQAKRKKKPDKGGKAAKETAQKIRRSSRIRKQTEKL
ncbi:hypothetical protein B0J13DRAFT_454440 [Dactylonectria estremocensis]|uniref:DUF7924 domain-containing protein n=1 Tax=Dactylonectria estremocensis TaxID=1079267 RepID=A0A9P9DUP8_9HYPO|nr:hypothetical protein B0J13DRAFT_454440 [Dactylonectria estremocensis]